MGMVIIHKIKKLLDAGYKSNRKFKLTEQISGKMVNYVAVVFVPKVNLKIPLA